MKDLLWLANVYLKLAFVFSNFADDYFNNSRTNFVRRIHETKK